MHNVVPKKKCIRSIVIQTGKINNIKYTHGFEGLNDTVLICDLMSCHIFLAQNFLFIRTKGFLLHCYTHLYTYKQWRKSIRRVKYKNKSFDRYVIFLTKSQLCEKKNERYLLLFFFLSFANMFFVFHTKLFLILIAI